MSALLLLVQLLQTLLVLGGLLTGLLQGSLLLSNTSTLVAQHTVGHQTLDLGSLITLVAVVLEGAANNELANVILLSQTEQLADVAGTLGAQTTGMGRGLVSESRDLLLTLLHNHQVQHADVRTHDATTHGLALSLSLDITSTIHLNSAASTVARASLGQQKTHTVIAQHTLLHGESLLVVSSGNADFSQNTPNAYRKM